MKKLALGVLVAWTAACGGATPPTSAPPPSAARIATPTEAASGTAGPGGPEVAVDPNRELARIRLVQPEATVRKALSLFPQYVPSIARDLRRLAELGVGKAAGVVAFDRPIEIRFFPHTPNPSMVLVAEPMGIRGARWEGTDYYAGGEPQQGPRPRRVPDQQGRRCVRDYASDKGASSFTNRAFVMKIDRQWLF